MEAFLGMELSGGGHACQAACSAVGRVSGKVGREEASTAALNMCVTPAGRSCTK